MNYLTEFNLYIDSVLIVYIFCAKIFLFSLRLMWEDSKKVRWPRRHNKQMIIIKIIKGTRGLGNKRTSGDHSNYYIIENVQNTEKSPGDLRLLKL